MKNYSEMSDFEINKAVGEIILEGKWACRPGSAGNDSESWYYGSVDAFVTPYPALPDYCNLWADAGPIIESEKISLTCSKVTGLWLAIHDRNSANHDPNPLRAAMITFLMMREGFNAKE